MSRFFSDISKNLVPSHRLSKMLREEPSEKSHFVDYGGSGGSWTLLLVDDTLLQLNDMNRASVFQAAAPQSDVSWLSHFILMTKNPCRLQSLHRLAADSINNGRRRELEGGTGPGRSLTLMVHRISKG